MSKDYNKLWVFGDSYTTPGYHVEPQDSFWGRAASCAKIPVIKNCSRPCNSFDSISHLLVGMHQQFDWHKDLFFIGLPPLERITVFDNHRNTEYLGTHIQTDTWQTQQFDVSCHRGLVCLQNYGTDHTLVVHADRAWVETQALRQIFLLSQWLDRCGANYLIVNLSKGFDANNKWGPSDILLPYVKMHDRCILFDDCYNDINVNINQPADFEIYGWNGHHGPVGNGYFFEKSLWPRLKKCNLV